MATRTSCERPTKEEFRVVVEYPKTPRERCRECCHGVGRALARSPIGPCLLFLVYAFLCLTALAISLSFVWMPILMARCQMTPGLDLQEVNVHAMNATRTDTAYQVDSEITLQLRAWNKNTVAGCFTTFRRVGVSVDFKGQRLLYQVVPLDGFGLKPQESRNMTLELRGEKAPVGTEIGSLLALELRNTSAVELTLSIAARWMRNDRKAGWMGMNCEAIAKTPPTSTGGLVYKTCDGL